MVVQSARGLVDKETLIKALDYLAITEEMGIGAYSKHLGAVLAWGGFPQAIRQESQGILESLVKESKVHKTAFEELIKKIKSSDKDVF